jgi:Raf kinase inhibitor-like YbhB/YbcL family protein
MRSSKIVLIPLAIICFSFSFPNRFLLQCNVDKKMDSLKVLSSAFNDTGFIPAKYTCDTENVSPPLIWTKGPKKTKTYILICDDPDAPSKTWVHWVLFNIPSSVTELPENLPTEKKILSGAIQGKNDFGTIGYNGPCPPSGTHRYYFKIYALDCELLLDSNAEKANVEDAEKGHILAAGVLIGKYQRK